MKKNTFFSVNIFFSFTLLILTACLISTLHAVTLDEATFLHSIILDDTVYYAKIAENVVAGRGFSFDGLDLTNGFQPLWQLVVVLLAYFVKDSVELLRVMSGVSSIFWVAAVLLAANIVKRHLGWLCSVFFLAGMLLNPPLTLVALRGMEVGVFALSFAYVFYVLDKDFDVWLSGKSKPSTHAWLQLGLALSLLGMARVDAFSLSMLIGLTILWKNKENLAQTHIWKAFSIPTIVGGSYLLWNVFMFNTFLPVSGSVKRFYVLSSEWENTWTYDLVFMSRHLHDLSTSAFSRGLEKFAWTVLQYPISGDRLANIFGLATLAGFTFCLYIYLNSWRKNPKYQSAFFLFFLFTSTVLVHFFLFTKMLPNFMIYGTWYFIPEYFFIWIGLSGILASLIHKFPAIQNSLRAISAGAILLAIFLCVWNETGTNAPPPQTSIFARAGTWLDSQVPPSRIGAFSSGILALKAKDHTVINLDGLVNSKEYLENYLKPGRFQNYVSEKRIEYISDYFTYDTLRTGVSWQGNIPTEQLTLVKWWPIDAQTAYVIYRIKNSSTDEDKKMTFDDPISQAEFKAKITGKNLAADIDAARLLITEEAQTISSFFVGERILFSIAPQTERLRLTELEAAYGKPAILFEDSGLALLYAEASDSIVRPGQKIIVSRTWFVLKDAERTNLRIDTYIRPMSPGWIWHLTSGLHEILPISQWKTGSIIKESYQITIPFDTPEGIYPLTIGLWDKEKKHWMHHSGIEDKGRPGMVWLGNLKVLK